MAQLFAAAMSSENPYANAVKLHEQAAPGTFGAAIQITNFCRDALGSAIKAGKPEYLNTLLVASSKRSEGPDQRTRNQIGFAQALQLVESRCRTFSVDLVIETPKSNDHYGIDYNRAQVELIENQKYPIDAIKALASQGQLYSAAHVLRNLPFFEGRQINDPEKMELFRRAVNLAEFNFTSKLDSQASDLRVLKACIDTGICDGTYESAELADWPADSQQRKTAREMARKIEIAFSKNDPTIFLLKR